MRQTRTFLFLTLGLLLLFSDILPTHAAPTLQSTPRPSPTYKVCHLCGEYVRTQTLPPLQARYGPAFDLLQVEVVTRPDIDLLYAIAGRFDVEQTVAFFAVSFSLYLTYLEPFVIRAVCIWCLSSAVIITLLLLLGTLSAVRLFAMPED